MNKMKCFYHPLEQAAAQCVDCHKGLCWKCAHQYKTPICPECNNKRIYTNLKEHFKSLIICTFLYIIGKIFYNKNIKSLSSTSFSIDANRTLSVSINNSNNLLFIVTFPITNYNEFNIGTLKVTFADDTYINLKLVVKTGVGTIVKIKFDNTKIPTYGRTGYYKDEQGSLTPYYLYPGFDELQALTTTKFENSSYVLNQHLRSLVPKTYNQVLFYFEDTYYYSWVTFKSTSGNDFNGINVNNSYLNDRVSIGWEGYMAVVYQYNPNAG